MPAGPSTDAIAIRAQVREADQAARRLILQAAHLEKRARRPRADQLERVRLEARALELRADAHALLAEISALSGQVATAA
jgi:ABC-type phosphate transport system auxiliary subunit